MRADELQPPKDIFQSFSYWKPYVVDSKQNNKVALAQEVFQRLLRAWNKSQVEPNMYVVKSSKGPWAASLDDRNILLSETALDFALSVGVEKGMHQLAFILAHELAHQQSDDLWGVRFSRLAGTHQSEIKKSLLHRLDIGHTNRSELERREAKADADGLIMMTLVGFNPYSILEGDGFFIEWVNSLWGVKCSNEKEENYNRLACLQAESRAIRAKIQLESIANKAIFFELGIQAFVAKKYITAIRYFEAYGYEFPSAEVHTNIGLSYLAEAVRIQQQLRMGSIQVIPKIYIPFVMELAADNIVPNENLVSSRSISDYNRLEKEYKQNIKSAIISFEKAVKLKPNQKILYLWISAGHLLDKNIPMARGILRGNYQRRFGEDNSFNLFIALIFIIEGRNEEAKNLLELLLCQNDKESSGSLPSNAYKYSLVKNYMLLNESMGIKGKMIAWKRLADSAGMKGDSLLFQYAIKEFNKIPNDGINQALIKELTQQRILLNKELITKSNVKKEREIIFDGEKLSYISNVNNIQSIQDTGGIVKWIWNISGANALAGTKITINTNSERVFKEIGIPNRKIFTNRGQYLAFDQIGISIYMVNGKVKGWFYY